MFPQAVIPSTPLASRRFAQDSLRSLRDHLHRAADAHLPRKRSGAGMQVARKTDVTLAPPTGQVGISFAACTGRPSAERDP